MVNDFGKWGVIAAAILIMVAKVNATTITNASWTFPTITVPGPSAPTGADFSTYSTDDYLAWVEANSKLGVNFVSNLGQGTALEFPITATRLII